MFYGVKIIIEGYEIMLKLEEFVFVFFVLKGVVVDDFLL